MKKHTKTLGVALLGLSLVACTTGNSPAENNSMENIGNPIENQVENNHSMENNHSHNAMAENPEHDHDHDHHHHDIGQLYAYQLPAGEYTLKTTYPKGGTIDFAFLDLGNGIDDIEHHASHVLSSEKEMISVGNPFLPKADYAYEFPQETPEESLVFSIEKDGEYAFAFSLEEEDLQWQILDKEGTVLTPISLEK
ncbi:hypothetical protein LQU94_00385 [Peptoniphilus sp. KCTC 25270]|uniref:hypothetical protein n=1 Tax=Peptoniphilus sp. KCTC 25270 TaxID=2897414 RepID=UPI001E32C91D|nr:hypothetical protein [Peptoniphilus sp. KCTC 25270]MCD1146572.1 hypothetical protein [Peptoniphilus sp. KCTC 25270]